MTACAVLIKNEHICSISRSILCKYAGVPHESQVDSVLDHLKSLGFNIQYNDPQKDNLSSAIRTACARVPRGRKRQVFLDKKYDWYVERAVFATNQLQAVLEEVCVVTEQRDEARKENQELAESLRSANTENVQLKIHNERLKRRKQKYALSRNVSQTPYSKTHRNRIKRQLADEAARVGLDLAGPSSGDTPSPSPAQAAVMVDVTNMSLRQYQQVTKFLPEC